MSLKFSSKISPFLWFNGQAHEAARYYTSIFKRSKVITTDTLAVTFLLEGIRFIAFNGGPNFKFTPAVSFFISCKSQRELDYYWKKLTAGGEPLPCGWLTDKYGVSWQVVPEILAKLLGDPDREKAGRAMAAMLKMKKLDIAKLKRAHAGRRSR